MKKNKDYEFEDILKFLEKMDIKHCALAKEVHCSESHLSTVFSRKENAGTNLKKRLTDVAIKNNYEPNVSNETINVNGFKSLTNDEKRIIALAIEYIRKTLEILVKYGVSLIKKTNSKL